MLGGEVGGQVGQRAKLVPQDPDQAMLPSTFSLTLSIQLCFPSSSSYFSSFSFLPNLEIEDTEGTLYLSHTPSASSRSLRDNDHCLAAEYLLKLPDLPGKDAGILLLQLLDEADHL